MRQIESLVTMRRQVRIWKRQGIRIGLVPTMGYLHEGHLSLIAKAQALVGSRGCVVVSIYVNPLQFGAGEDFTQYPRDPARDRRLCRAAGVDVIFAPSNRALYPPASRHRGGYSTYVVEEGLSRPMEGLKRPTHFRGVTTIVAKLFNLIQPDVAIFGAKDYQQARIIERMVRDLNIPVKMVVEPTVREPDGLALSSRNCYLNAGQRTQATALWQAIQTARSQVRTASRPLAATTLRRRLTRQIQRQPEARVDYVHFFDPMTLCPVSRVRRGTHLAMAVFIGSTRLIDNARL